MPTDLIAVSRPIDLRAVVWPHLRDRKSVV